jgi:hypothetical protein
LYIRCCLHHWRLGHLGHFSGRCPTARFCR